MASGQIQRGDCIRVGPEDGSVCSTVWPWTRSRASVGGSRPRGI